MHVLYSCEKSQFLTEYVFDVMDRRTKLLTLKCENARSRVWGHINTVLKLVQVSVKTVMGWPPPPHPASLTAYTVR